MKRALLLYIPATRKESELKRYKILYFPVRGGEIIVEVVEASDSYQALKQFLEKQGYEVITRQVEGALDKEALELAKEVDEVHVDITRGRRSMAINLRGLVSAYLGDKALVWYGGWQEDGTSGSYVMLPVIFIPGVFAELWMSLSPRVVDVLESLSPLAARRNPKVAQALKKIKALYLSLLYSVYSKEALKEDDISIFIEFLESLEIGKVLAEEYSSGGKIIRNIIERSGFLHDGVERCKRVTQFYADHGHVNLFYLFVSQLVDNVVGCLLDAYTDICGGKESKKNPREVIPSFWKSAYENKCLSFIQEQEIDQSRKDVLSKICNKFQEIREYRHMFAHGAAKEAKNLRSLLSRLKDPKKKEEILRELFEILDSAGKLCRQPSRI